jgi:hypothetical protein
MVPQSDPAAMAQAAMRYLTEPGLAERLTTAGLRECENYQWPAVRDRWLATYRELHSGTASPKEAQTTQMRGKTVTDGMNPRKMEEL